MKRLVYAKLAFALILFSMLTPVVSAETDVDRVIIISVDSMNNNLLFNEYDNPGFRITPNIGELVLQGTAFTKAEAVMPTKTQVNHITIVSGSYAERIGIVGNYVFDPTKKGGLFLQKYDFPWKNPDLIKADTIFKAIERENPEYTSAVVAGKNYVGSPIWADIQSGPAYASEWARRLGIKKFPEIQLWDSPDEWVMDNALLVLNEVDPDIMLIHLGFVDPVQHSFGHGSRESWAALAWADYQIGRLLLYLTETGGLERTLIVVTADHGQTNAWQRIPLGKILRGEGVAANVIADGAFASIFLADGSDLDKAVEVLSSLKSIDGLWYGDSFDEVKIRTPYTGDIAVSLAPPYEAFSKVRPPFLGIHGGLQQRFVPIVFFGPNVKRGLTMEYASLTDIVPTICEITGYPLPEGSQGEVLPVMDREITTAPQIAPRLIEYPRTGISYITALFFLLSVSSLVPTLMIWRSQGGETLEISKDSHLNFVPLVLLTSGVIFATSSSLYSYILNLYSIPGVQPDSFLVAMDFGILGSFLISFLFVLVILWYAPMIFRIVTQRVRRRMLRIRVIPQAYIALTVSQLLFSSISMMFKIPYFLVFEIFIAFFFGGLGVSYVYRILIIKHHVVDGRRGVMASMIISGVLTAIAWFYLLMFVLFPSYLHEYGIRSIY